MQIAPGQQLETVTDTGRWSLVGTLYPGGSSYIHEVREPGSRIGRRPELQLSIPSPVVSGHHATLRLDGAELWLEDNHSTNGTFVNGERIEGAVKLSAGDILEFGDARFELARPCRRPQNQDSAALDKTSLQENRPDTELQQALRRLVRHGELAACFQAIHHLDSSDVYGYEFLARSEVNGLKTPGQMFGAAEAFDFECELSAFCREEALDRSRILPAGVPLFLNTHPAEDLLEEVVPQMADLRSRYPQRDLVLEIHESAVTDPELIRELRAQLAKSDIRLAFDDFGAGQARIRELFCSPSDFIKFDAALLRDLRHVSPEQIEFFRSIVSGIHREGAVTIAEGIEDDGLAKLCRSIGFDLVQGYLFSRPAFF